MYALNFNCFSGSASGTCLNKTASWREYYRLIVTCEVGSSHSLRTPEVWRSDSTHYIAVVRDGPRIGSRPAVLLSWEEILSESCDSRNETTGPSASCLKQMRRNLPLWSMKASVVELYDCASTLSHVPTWQFYSIVFTPDWGSPPTATYQRLQFGKAKTGSKRSDATMGAPWS